MGDANLQFKIDLQYTSYGEFSTYTKNIGGMHLLHSPGFTPMCVTAIGIQASCSIRFRVVFADCRIKFSHKVKDQSIIKQKSKVVT